MKNRDIERLIRLYINGTITYEELIEYLDKLNNKELKEPPTLY